MLLPEGFTLPPAPYLLGLTVTSLVVAALLLRANPRVTQHTVIAFVPWMFVGGALHVLAVADIASTIVQPALEVPAVYAMTFVLFGIAWLVALGQRSVVDEPRPVAVILGVLGLVAAGIVLLSILQAGLARNQLMLWWPLVAIVASVGLTAACWLVFAQFFPEAATVTGWAGAIALFGHVFDGVTTTIGVDILGWGERSPIPLMIMDMAGQLPVADVIGVGWAFILLKILVAGFVVWLCEEYVREAPRQAYVLLAVIAAVGMGPGVHNLLLLLV